MLVTKRNFDTFLSDFTKSPKMGVGLDTETTGIWWWDTPHVPWYDPRIFSVQFSTPDKKDFYLDFQHSDDKLSDAHFEKLYKEIFSDPEYYWFIHNGKFELHHFRNHGVEIEGTIHCTKHIARVVNNVEEDLKLDSLGTKYLNAPKLDVKTYISENKLFTKVKKWGVSGKEDDWLHFDKLPLSMLIEYGEKDTQICRDLGLWQLERIKEYDQVYFSGSNASLTSVLKNENELTKTVFEMERVGVKIDRAYCEEAYFHEVAEYKEVKKELDAFAIAANVGEIDWLSPQQLKKFFEARGDKSYKITEKGSMSFDKEALEAMDSPAAKAVLKYRYHYKRAHTYFENFIWLADSNDIIHADIQNSGTDTGRQSIWNPNLQNIPKRRDKDESKYKVRRCFVPRTEDDFIFMDKDYSGAEFYMAMDYAKELPVIDRIKQGLDPHTFTREKINSKIGKEILKDRDTAKTMTFRIIYGAGGETIGVACGFKKGWEAKKYGKQIKEMYFSEFPAFGGFIQKVQNAAKGRGYVFNWLGRVLQYKNTGGFGVENWFKSPNGIIQGGIGDTLKVAMNRIHAEFKRLKVKSRMCIPVHDAILFEIHKSELFLIPVIHEIMINAYPAKILQLEADHGFSEKSWAELQDSIPGVTLDA